MLPAYFAHSCIINIQQKSLIAIFFFFFLIFFGSGVRNGNIQGNIYKIGAIFPVIGSRCTLDRFLCSVYIKSGS